jgi:acyl-CoA thioester hydrolase
LSEAPQLTPISELSPYPGLSANTEKWFEYPIQVYPHHTDYSGVVWHGTYLTWLESARVEYLKTIGVNFADVVGLGCDLPVVELSLRYHRSLKLGQSAIVKARLYELKGVRLNWDYKIQSPDDQQLYLSGTVTLVAIDREQGKILRQLPPAVKDIFIKLLHS